jgi:Arc/MetJ-type ribon-helix-helix transcriptional regulator
MAHPRNTALVTVSLPRPIARQIERVRKREHRSRSELVREALRVYFARAAAFPEVTATAAEIRALKRARREYLAGNTITLDEYDYARALDGAPRSNGGKAARPTAAPRPRRDPRSAPKASR